MAARKGRAENKVLSRQEISTRKRALSEKKLATPTAAKRAIIGTLLLTVCSLLALSVLTFHPRDRVGPGFHNAVGPVGHALAETFKGLFGICALVIPAAGFYAAAILFVGDRAKQRWPQLLSAFLLTLSGAVLAQICFGDQPGWAHPPGGAVGFFFAELLSGLFSTVGTVILVTAVCVVALIVGTQFVFLKLCALAWVGAQEVGYQAQVLSGLLWEKLQAAYQDHREKSAQAKEEEAAFLAQLEADEEDLLAAETELEAQEADAIAEEAMRLAKEAQERRKKEAKEAKLAAKAEKVAERTAKEERATVDPAWASELGAVPEAPSAVELPPGKREKKQPAVISAPGPLPTEESAVLAQATLPATLAATPKVTALARTPVIVEPKAPPKPSKSNEADFEFVGDRKSFTLPPIDVLSAEKVERTALDKEAFLSTAEKLRAKLADFGIDGEVVEIRPGPVVTMYEFLPGPGIKVSKIASLSDDLAMAMEAMRVRIVAPIPGKGVVGIEVPNKDRETVYLRAIAEQDAFTKSASKLTMCVGKDIEGMPYVLDLAKAPHILIAGTTGSGKSVAVNSMIMSILLKSTPEEVRFIMVDPKMLELSVYEGIPHLLLPVVTDPKKAALALRWAVEEMERRYQMLAEAGVRNIAGFNKLVETQASEKPAPKPAADAKKKMRIVEVAPGESPDEALARADSSSGSEMGVPAPRDLPEEMREANPDPLSEAAPELPPTPQESAALAAAEDAAKEAAEKKKELKKLPYIVVIIDELADLMMVASREVETFVARLAQMARAAGIHLMVATQRPSTDVVTGVIKANFPTRISFMLRSKPDSMTILGTVGSEALLGMGDMLIMPPTSAHLQRVHGAFVSETEIKAAVDHLKAQGKPVYDDSILKPREEDNEGGGEDDELSDELYDQALAVVSDMRTVSISMLQRKMRIGYNRAARMIERMERDGVVGAADGAKPREVLIRPLGEMPGAGAM